MTTSNRLLNFLLVLLMTTTLLSCGVETSSLPPERPMGQVTGNAIDSAISNATVSVYSFANGVRGARLGSGTTDGAGTFSVDIQAESQLVMVEVTGGTYVEEASGKEVGLTDGQNLRSLVRYESGETVNTNVTPLTHMATALAEYKIANGTIPGQAMDEGFGMIDEFFTLDSRGVASINITNDNPTLNTLDDEVKYGFYLAGLSSWTKKASQDNNTPAHSIYTTAGLAQVMYRDIVSDGRLDGLGPFNKDGSQQPLALGPNASLNADEYRKAFSIHILAMANSVTINKTGLALDDVKDLAEIMRNKTGEFLNTEIPLDISSQGITFSLPEMNDFYSSKLVIMPTIEEGILGINRVAITIDGDPVIPEGDPLVFPWVIDISGYNEERMYTVVVEVFNALDFSDSKQFSTGFDNIGPVVEVVNEAAVLPPLTNESTVSLAGTVSATYAPLQSFTITHNGNPIVPDVTNGSWSNEIALVSGENEILITASDEAGNEYASNYQVILDTIPPVIGATDNASVLFSYGNGVYGSEEPLADDNSNSLPLYLETNYIGFNVPYGKALNRETLSGDGVPYFAFTIQDFRYDGAPTTLDQLSLHLTYKRGPAESVLKDWDLPVQPQCESSESAPLTNCEYYLPLISEFLDPPPGEVISNWYQTNPNDVHTLTVELSDGAGNSVTKDFTFKVDFYVPEIPLCEQGSCTQGELVVTDLDPFTGKFDMRVELFNQSLDTTQYTFTNPSAKPIYVRFSGGNTHSVDQIVDKLVRVHEIQEVEIREWRMGTMQLDQVCPFEASNPSSWIVTRSVWNWNGNNWEEVSVKTPIGTVINHDSDILPDSTIQTTVWENAGDSPDFDQQYQSGEAANGNLTLNYDYTYEDPTGLPGLPLAAVVSNWTFGGGTCPDQRYIQQRNTYEFESVRGPERVLTQDLSLNGELEFYTSGLVVNNENNDVITPITDNNNNEWYEIAAGSQVTITKVVDPRPLNLVPYDDPLETDTYSPKYQDKSIIWKISQDLTIHAIHKTNEDSIGEMSQRITNSNEGLATHVISRPQ
jgi:hypothetical protein